MKIIYGKYKNRLVPTLKNSDYRPTTGSFREALFSILTSGKLTNKPDLLVNAKILDLFAGTGIFSFEALSRGAKSATLIDINQSHLKMIQQFREQLDEVNDIECRLLDATALGKTSKRYNIVFIDPPYGFDLCTKSLKCLLKNEWLEDGAVIVLKMEKTAKLDLSLFPGLGVVKEKIYGKSKLLIVKYG